MIKYFLILTLLVSTQYSTAQNLASARRHIEAANKAYGERFQTNDAAFFAARYTQDACIMPEKMERLCGRDAIRTYYYNNGQNRDFQLKTNTLEIYGGREGVVEEGTYQLLDKVGIALDKGKFIATWRYEDKQWKLRREIWTTDMPEQGPVTAEKPGYDSVLAKKLGADDYGMKRFVLVMLKTGPAQISEKARVDSLFAGHMANMGRLAEAGKLVMAGPIGRKEKYRGLFVFEVTDMEEAKTLTATDPAIQAGLLEPEFMPFYGSAALKMLNEWHERVQKVKM
jgi:ketosteroid isomerase-like protein/uncharacterized protein YciI